jgi:pimeloyl-ACP methyl ester carboxylesterase
MRNRQEGSVVSFDGTRLYYCSEGTGVPLVACNGILCSVGYWVYFRPHFRRWCQVVCWDYRGHGKSALPADPSNVTVPCYAEDLKAVIDGLDIPKAVLLGHSMGVQVILEFYKKYPERVAALVPICGTYGHPFKTFYGRAWLEKVYPSLLGFGQRHARGLEKAVKPLLPTRLPFAIAKLIGAIHWYLCPKEIMDDYFRHIAQMDFDFGIRALKAMGSHTAEDVVPSIRVPTLVIAGDRDRFTPVGIAEKMWRTIPGAELLIIPRGTHTALVEQPSLMNLRIEIFLRDHLNLRKPEKGTGRTTGGKAKAAIGTLREGSSAAASLSRRPSRKKSLPDAS